MKKINKLNFTPILFFLLILLYFSKSLGDEKANFLTLKNKEVNLRQGPSFEYPIRLTYKKKNLPVVIIDKHENWIKIKDFKNNFGWIHISQLSKKKSAINLTKGSIVYKKPTIYSKPIVKLEIGRLVLIKKCKIQWCKITSGGFGGWIFKDNLWGKFK
jgi:SH3-like domain-containing protein